MKLSKEEKYHLYRRACFFEHSANMHKSEEAEKIVDAIFKEQKITPLTIDIPEWSESVAKKSKGKKGQALRKKWRKDVQVLNHMWVRQMMAPKYGLQEKMTLFWHGHFACRTVTSPYGTMALNNVIRENALGSFKELLFAVSKSAPMINYLHLRQNKKGHPNEDFARELCELFTLGRDVDYTEKDVQEIARAFTGWRSDPMGKHIVVERLHDNGEKTIFGKTGNFNGEDVLNMILENKNTARFISKKLFKFLVEEKENQDAIEEIATSLYNSNYDIKAALKTIFTSNWFYASRGKLILGPTEFLVLLGKLFDLKYDDVKTIIKMEAYLGQVLFDPPNVAGWPGGRKWIDSSRLALRLRLGSLIINRGYIEDALTPELDAMIKKKQPKKKEVKFYEDVDWDAFFKLNAPEDLYSVFITTNNPGLKANYGEITLKEIIELISTPDFQMT